MINVQLDSNYHNMENFVFNIKKHFSENKNTIFAKRNIIKILEYNNKKIVVKSFKIPNLVNQFAYKFIRDSKAKRSFLNAQKLVKLDVKTPKPIAYVEFFDPLLGESFYICEHFDYDFEIRAVLRDSHFEDRENIFKEFALFSYELHQKGVYHIDFSPGNVLIKKKVDRYIFSIVDVNRMRFMKFDDKLRFQNLSRFSATDEDTKIIAKEYAKVSGIDESFAIRELFFFHQKHQKYMQNKKRLKRLKL